MEYIPDSVPARDIIKDNLHTLGLEANLFHILGVLRLERVQFVLHVKLLIVLMAVENLAHSFWLNGVGQVHILLRR